jgi:hypothetical protein
MITWTIHHYVTGEGDSTTVNGDDAVAVWLVSDYATDAPDLTIEQPPEGFTWTVGMEGYIVSPWSQQAIE